MGERKITNGLFTWNSTEKDKKNRSIFMIWYWNWLLFVVFTFFTISKSIFFLWSEASLKMAVNFIKEIEVITVSLETQAGIAGNFVWSQGREKSQIKNILLQISWHLPTYLPPAPEKDIDLYSSVVSTSFTNK